MKVLSLFDGMSCGRIALERAGIEVTRYVAYEIDPAAIMVSQWNYPDIEQMGSVVGADFSQFKGFDLVIAGSPCQGFSFAGKQLNFEDPRSKLFFEFVRALDEVGPRFFLLENVVMKQEYQDVITDLLGVPPVLINSALVSAQNRRRLYWTNVEGLEQPEDLGLLLRDIIEGGQVDRDKSLVLVTRVHGGAAVNHYFNRNMHQLVTLEPGDPLRSWPRKPKHEIKLAHRTASQVERLIKRSKTPEDKSHGIIQGTVDSTKQGATNLFLPAEGYEVKDGVLHFEGRNAPVKLADGFYSFRTLTPVECERLQTVPDGYTEVAPMSQRYRMLGNGWTVDVIAHIFKQIEVNDLL